MANQRLSGTRRTLSVGQPSAAFHTTTFSDSEPNCPYHQPAKSLTNAERVSGLAAAKRFERIRSSSWKVSQVLSDHRFASTIRSGSRSQPCSSRKSLAATMCSRRYPCS